MTVTAAKSAERLDMATRSVAQTSPGRESTIIVASIGTIVMIAAIAGGLAMEGEAAFASIISQDRVATGALGGGRETIVAEGGVTRRSTTAETTIATSKSKLLQWSQTMMTMKRRNASLICALKKKKKTMI